MKHEEMIEQTKQWVKEQLWGEGSGHDWYHIERVTKTASKLAAIEHADHSVVTLASLLHDLADDKLVEDEAEGLLNIRKWLLNLDLEVEHIDHIQLIISTMSFKGGNKKPMQTLEGRIVQDADRLDALGAIGIARTFVYSGNKSRPMYDPTLPVRELMTEEEYRNGDSSAIHHFHEKLLKLKDLMNTEAGKQLATERHQFMKTFLKQFEREWHGHV
ncbi:HD domain-containing protein [Bacillus sp. FJAT-45037]|uniref:HD domain-containing protein n=1 Tax=Bacillus sp. FJAT-45037 TaxID=2011007 RepID=UPI000C239A4F|nr:HD domain-containing protein [Bacillus sp. FJAT-45037]